jgi:hypothetical protein
MPDGFKGTVFRKNYMGDYIYALKKLHIGIGVLTKKYQNLSYLGY